MEITGVFLERRKLVAVEPKKCTAATASLLPPHQYPVRCSAPGPAPGTAANLWPLPLSLSFFNLCKKSIGRTPNPYDYALSCCQSAPHPASHHTEQTVLFAALWRRRCCSSEAKVLCTLGTACHHIHLHELVHVSPLWNRTIKVMFSFLIKSPPSHWPCNRAVCTLYGKPYPWTTGCLMGSRCWELLQSKQSDQV